MITLIEDCNQKPQKHEVKNAWWRDNGIAVERYRLPVGDYVLRNDAMAEMILRKQKRGINPRMMDFIGTYDISCDTKCAISELCENVCGPQHDRFRDECMLAKNNGIKLVILVENKPERIGRTNEWNPMIHSLYELHKWRNPRLFIWKNGKQAYPKATKGITLQKACMTLSERYGVEFLFCSPEEAGRRVVEILTENEPQAQ